jgi:hypothetical protein
MAGPVLTDCVRCRKAKAAPKKAAAAAFGGGGGGRRRVVMPAFREHVEGPELLQGLSVYGEYDMLLNQCDSVAANTNKFYKIQIVQNGSGEFYVVT